MVKIATALVLSLSAVCAFAQTAEPATSSKGTSNPFEVTGLGSQKGGSRSCLLETPVGLRTLSCSDASQVVVIKDGKAVCISGDIAKKVVPAKMLKVTGYCHDGMGTKN